MEKPRNYIGASMVGEECWRKVWFSLNHPFRITDGRRLRIFDMGKMIETYVVDLLKKAGFEVFDKDENGNQFNVAWPFLKGSADGVIVIDNVPHLLEIKSCKDSTFKLYRKNKLQATNMQYWYQCQIYMHGLQVDHALFVAMNKDTQDLYFEFVKYDHTAFTFALEKARIISESKEAPEREYKEKTFFKCKMCEYQEDCWEA
jgi:hypothetical protein